MEEHENHTTRYHPHKPLLCPSFQTTSSVKTLPRAISLQYVHPYTLRRSSGHQFRRKKQHQDPQHNPVHRERPKPPPPHPRHEPRHASIRHHK